MKKYLFTFLTLAFFSTSFALTPKETIYEYDAQRPTHLIGDANIRSCASKKCKVIKVGLDDEPVTIFGESGNWYKVYFLKDDWLKVGYISKSILDKDR